VNDICENSKFEMKLHGFDTIQCAYYMEPSINASIDFQLLASIKESIRHSKNKSPRPILLGNTEFLLHSSGSSSGYPFIISNAFFKIELGEFNTPNFFVTFPSKALWQDSPYNLHKKFINWASSVGYEQYISESLSRADYCFDYKLEELDFNEDSFVSRAAKDSKHRENGKAQTFTFGKDDIVLRVYDKVAEIEQQSDKTWFFILWGEDGHIWRIEWQIRKDILKTFGIVTFQDLKERIGNLLQYLAEDHDTLRIQTEDSNRSRWPLHPLWADLQENIKNLTALEVCEVYGQTASLEERMMQIIISMYGYLKRLAAIRCIREKQSKISLDATVSYMNQLITNKLHENLSWQMDIEKRVKEMQLGEW
jgi:hypothetical protein